MKRTKNALVGLTGALMATMALIPLFAYAAQPQQGERESKPVLEVSDFRHEEPAEEAPYVEEEPWGDLSYEDCEEVYVYPIYENYPLETVSGGSPDDFRTAGVIYEDGQRYTWYSENVLPGGGLNELNSNGRHVDEDGLIRDGDGYIAVATDAQEKGAIVDTPFGQGKVYDSGCGDTIDVYVGW